MERTSEQRACHGGRGDRTETRLEAVTPSDWKMIELILERADDRLGEKLKAR